MTAAGWELLVQHLAKSDAGRGWVPPQERRGPLPRGSVAPGSCSDEVLAYLRSRPGAPQAFAAICRAVDRPQRSISWSLVFLRGRGLIFSREVGRGVHEWWHPAPDERAASPQAGGPDPPASLPPVTPATDT